MTSRLSPNPANRSQKAPWIKAICEIGGKEVVPSIDLFTAGSLGKPKSKLCGMPACRWGSEQVKQPYGVVGPSLEWWGLGGLVWEAI